MVNNHKIDMEKLIEPYDIDNHKCEEYEYIREIVKMEYNPNRITMDWIPYILELHACGNANYETATKLNLNANTVGKYLKYLHDYEKETGENLHQLVMNRERTPWPPRR